MKGILMRRLLSVLTAACLVGSGLLLSTSPSLAATAATPAIQPGVAVVFDVTGEHELQVPAWATEMSIRAVGGTGGAYTTSPSSPLGGAGALAEASFPVSGGEALTVFVAGHGALSSDGAAFGDGGFGGGGAARGFDSQGRDAQSGGGGGASDVRLGGAALSDRILVAGGGGGADWYSAGGSAGATAGDGTTAPGSGCAGNHGGGGGTLTAGGRGGAACSGTASHPGTFGLGGDGANKPTASNLGSGGGGGWYGGGGGGIHSTGGAGSSYAASSALSSSITTAPHRESPMVSISFQGRTASTVTVEAADAAIVADGSSTTTITATPRTADDLPAYALSATIFSPDLRGGTLSPTTANGDGTFSATYTAGLSLGRVVFEAISGAVTAQTTLQLTVGPLAIIEFDERDVSVVAGGSPVTATVRFFDAQRRPVLAQTVRFSVNPTMPLRVNVATVHDTLQLTLDPSNVRTAGPVVLTATSYGRQASLPVTVSPAVPTSISAALTPPTLVADGTSTTSVVATVTDARGFPTAGHTVSFASTDSGHAFGPVIDAGDGTYSATLTSSRTLGSSTITAQVAGFTGHVVLTQHPGHAHTVMAASSSSLVADGQSRTAVTVNVLDAVGHPVPGATISATSSDADQRLSAVTDNGDGTYSLQVTASTTAGTARITIDAAGLASTTLVLVQAAGPVDPARSTLTLGTTSPVPADGDTDVELDVQARDAFGNIVSGLALTPTSTDAGHRFSGFTETTPGTYSATLRTSRTPGTSTVTVTAGGAAPALMLRTLAAPVVIGSVTLTQSAVPVTPPAPPVTPPGPPVPPVTPPAPPVTPETPPAPPVVPGDDDATDDTDGGGATPDRGDDDGGHTDATDRPGSAPSPDRALAATGAGNANAAAGAGLLALLAGLGLLLRRRHTTASR